ncbi:MAG: helix-turn-helix transcriptional regulator [Gammaproteobacteria bacterium]|nr:helix-turn-helix transcriptional regulator [Gammaproteobacteria bacterium]
MNDTATKLREWRDAGGMSQEDAARVFLVSISTYQSWELGRREPDGRNAEKVERVLGGKR